jgi:glucosylceramidase
MLVFATAGSAGSRRSTANESVQVWLTNTSGSSTVGGFGTKLAQQGNVTFGAQTGTTPAIDVNSGTTYQTMDGFGAAMTDSAANLIFNSSARNSIMSDLFSSSGIGLNFVRLPMGASDISLSNYSYDDTAGDTSLSQFSVAHDAAYIIPIMQQARSLTGNTLKILGTPWSAPGWMKIGGTFVGNCSGSSNYLQNSLYTTYANYFVKFVQAYQNTYGLPIYMVSMQNEPHNCNSTYATMSMEPADQATFAGNLRTALNNAGFGGIKILAWDHNWYENGSGSTYPQSVLNANSGAVSAIGWHCYSGPTPGAQAVGTTLHNQYPSKDQYMTECTGGSWATNAASNFVWDLQNLLIEPTRNWSKGSLYWSIALDPNGNPHVGGCAGCRGMVTVNGGSYTKNEDYYAWGHFSKFVPPGAVRVDSTDLGNGSIETAAFKNPDGSLVLVALNSGTGSRTFQVRWNGQGFTYTLAGSSSATFKWTPGGGGGDTTPPSAPSGLTSPSHTDVSVALSWGASSDNVGVTGYRVYRNGTQVGTPTATSYTDTGLTASTAYTYTVKAVDAAGNLSAASNSVAVTTNASSGGGITPGAWYQVINQNSNACVDQAGGGTANGTIVQQWACVTGSTNQGWQFRATDSGYYNVLNRTAAAQNEVWDVTGGTGATGDSVKIQTWAYGGGTNEQWLPVSLGSGYYKMVARNSGKCLDVPGASTANGVQLQQYTCNGTAAQAWRLVQQ